jgi:hypothetical protein
MGGLIVVYKRINLLKTSTTPGKYVAEPTLWKDIARSETLNCKDALSSVARSVTHCYCCRRQM